MFAHKYFRVKVHAGPRTAWTIDYYGCAKSAQGYNNILGAVDMVTCLFTTKKRTGSITTDAILQGIVLRDGVPKVIHSDHAREFVGQCLKTLTKVFGITKDYDIGAPPYRKCKNGKSVSICHKMSTTNEHRTIQKLTSILDDHCGHRHMELHRSTMGVSPFETCRLTRK